VLRTVKVQCNWSMDWMMMEHRDSCIPLLVPENSTSKIFKELHFFTEADNNCSYGWWMDALESHTLSWSWNGSIFVDVEERFANYHYRYW
jgi:hypothetical protein